MRSRHTSPARLLLLILAALLCASTTVRANEEDDYEPEEYDETARVVRVSLMRGEVSLRRAGNVEWEPARLNLPLVEGDTLATGRDARVEIQFDAYNFVRVGEDSVLRVVTLREEGVALSLSEGTASVRLARFEREREYFEIDAPKSTVSAETKGLYRVDVGRDGGVRVTVRDEGRARVYSETSGFLLRSNRTARLAYDTFADGDWEISQAEAFDDWDAWNDERERHLAVILRYDHRERYYDADIYGAEELSSYGDWYFDNTYGWIWRPRASVISQYPDWAPYRHGHWRWVPPYGWTWVGDEPWGWAPYHYGRWVYISNTWCWVPRAHKQRRAWWRPALVVFVKIGRGLGRLGRYGHGNHIAWYPLGYGHHDPHSRNYRRGRRDRRDRHERRPLEPMRGSEAAELIRRNPELMRAVTVLREQEFGTQRARPAPRDIAERAMTGEPVQGRLPITPADVERRNTRTGTDGRTATVPPREGAERATGGRAGADDSREGLTIVRPARVSPPRDVPARQTGAAERTPGVPLDDALRRARVFQGREPRVAPPASAGGGGGIGRGEDRDTGVVARPARPPRSNPDERIAAPEVTTRPERVRPDARGREDRDDDDDRITQPAARPSRPAESQPRVYERPERARPEGGERMRPAPRESPRAAPPRESAPTPRHEPRQSSPPPARHDPPQERRESPPPPPPQESSPPPRESSPPPPPPSPPPARSDPPARDSERERPARPPRGRR